MRSERGRPGEDEIGEWLIKRIATHLKVGTELIAVDRPFTQMGIDSTEAVVLSGDLQEWLGRRIPPTIAWDYPTIETLGKHLAE